MANDLKINYLSQILLDLSQILLALNFGLRPHQLSLLRNLELVV